MELHEIEQRRRAIVMLTPGQMALRREEAIALLEELAETREQLNRAVSERAASALLATDAGAPPSDRGRTETPR